ncbi:MAG: carboxylesterase family protein [Bacteroidaceae bacterium]|nr:carboxylesterase family protein [Bacteroidaceae bacterium]
MKLHLFCIIGIIALSACTSQQPANNPILSVEGGQIQGIASNDSSVTVFKGVPYAAAPIGDLRWKAPQPVKAWDGVRIADTWGAAAMQNSGKATGDFYYKEFYAEGDPQFSEDCLYLNIWTPSNAVGQAEKKLPVAMWIHGGAYDHGYGYEITMDGDAWAKRGVILVTINYRVGIFGFLAHPELIAEDAQHSSGNYGTQDQIAALKWIKNNISQFGGDPSNITILGQSAGAASIKNLVSSPLSKELVSHAIIQSAGGIDEQVMPEQPLEEFADLCKQLMDENGLTDLQKMRAASADELLKIFNNKPAQLRFRPHYDGVVLNNNFTASTLDGSIADIPYMIGYCANDNPSMGAGIQRFATERKKQGSKPVYTYIFARPLPGDDAGSFHSSELWFMFHTLDRAWRPFTKADYRLADEMTDAWTNFAKTGNPNAPSSNNWKPYNPENDFTYVFDIE